MEIESLGNKVMSISEKYADIVEKRLISALKKMRLKAIR